MGDNDSDSFAVAAAIADVFAMAASSIVVLLADDKCIQVGRWCEEETVDVRDNNRRRLLLQVELDEEDDESSFVVVVGERVGLFVSRLMAVGGGGVLSITCAAAGDDDGAATGAARTISLGKRRTLPAAFIPTPQPPPRTARLGGNKVMVMDRPLVD